MTLNELLQNIDGYPGSGTILAEEPWVPQSRAIVREFAAETPAAAMADEDRTYFLEVFLAQELRGDLLAAGWKDEAAICDRIISYAINDA